MNSSLAIIPARAGSKRIPNKNIRNFHGNPIISYPINLLIQSGLFQEVMVSTDSNIIAGIALKYGAKVPFLRSEKNSSDHATTLDVLLEVIENYKDLGIEFNYICCVYPCTPLLQKESLIDAYKAIIENPQIDTVLGVIEYSHPIQRALMLDLQGRITPKYPENMISRTQDLENNYHDSGQFYFFRLKTILEKKSIWETQIKGILLDPDKVQDIDTQYDWDIAELKYERLGKKILRDFL